jgi:hypothetical protein
MKMIDKIKNILVKHKLFNSDAAELEAFRIKFLEVRTFKSGFAEFKMFLTIKKRIWTSSQFVKTSAEEK